MNEQQWIDLMFGAYIGFGLTLAGWDAREWVLDEYYAWRLRRNYRKLYWFVQ